LTRALARRPSSTAALRIPSSQGTWLRVENVLGAVRGQYLNGFTLSYQFRLSGPLPVDTVCLLFHPDGTPDILSTSLMLDHEGRLLVGENVIPHSARVRGGDDQWHQIAVAMSLSHQAEQSEYRIFLDGREIALLTHSGMLDLSADYVAAIRDAFALGIVTPRPADLLSGDLALRASWTAWLRPPAAGGVPPLPDIHIKEVWFPTRGHGARSVARPVSTHSGAFDEPLF
jgi:hypothetical protein